MIKMYAVWEIINDNEAGKVKEFRKIWKIECFAV